MCHYSGNLYQEPYTHNPIPPPVGQVMPNMTPQYLGFVPNAYMPPQRNSIPVFSSPNMQFSVAHSTHTTESAPATAPPIGQATLTQVYNPLGPPLSTSSLPTVSPDVESGLIAGQRRNTTTGHNLMSSPSNMNIQHPGLYPTLSPYPHFTDNYSASSNAVMTGNQFPNISSDNSKFLYFLSPVQEISVHDNHNNPISIGLVGHLSGQFLLSPTGPSSSSMNPPNDLDQESQEPLKLSPDVLSDKQSTPTKDQTSPKLSPTNSDSPQQPQLELTFYRRNLFQVLCTVTNARNEMYACSPGEESTHKSRIIGLSMEVSISGTDETKKPKLLYTPPKPDANKQKQEPIVKHLRPKDNVQAEVVDWKRLQFNSATLHNGRRRLQNYFTLTVAVIAELDNRKRVRLVYANSRPIVVRGRNPRFYSNRQTIAISEIGSSATSIGQRPLLDTFTSRSPHLKAEPGKPIYEEKGDSSQKSVSSKKIKHEEEDDDDDDDVNDDDDQGSYEYISMPPNYYQPPVEVVYRPHANTHPNTRSRRTGPSMISAGLEPTLKRAFASTA